MAYLLSRLLLCVTIAAGGAASQLPAKCDDLPWANQSVHKSGGNGTSQDAFSWHIHYLHNTTDQEADVEAFQSAFCKEFAKYGADGSSIQSCSWGPNYLGYQEKHICGSCSGLDEKVNFPPGGCGAGVCTDPAHGPWSTCQNEFFVAQEYIDEVTAFISKPENYRSIGVMRHPNTGCQWGDHFIRAEFFGAVKPEMCLWGLPCNDPGYGCYSGMCGTINASTHQHQHASGCELETKDSLIV
jgi:hypothetical protein